MTLYVVKVHGPTPAWIDWDHDRNLPTFTFVHPHGLSKAEAEYLKERADICCGGNTEVVRFRPSAKWRAILKDLPAPADVGDTQ